MKLVIPFQSRIRFSRCVLLVVSLILIIGFSGCASIPTISYLNLPDLNTPVSDKTKGRIYIIRDEAGFGVAQGAGYVLFDGVEIGEVGHAGFIVFEAETGDHKLRVEPRVALTMGKTIDINIEAGKRYYVHTKITVVPIIGTWVTVMKIVNEKEGLVLLKKTKPGVYISEEERAKAKAEKEAQREKDMKTNEL